jgi:hypothetical protein
MEGSAHQHPVTARTTKNYYGGMHPLSQRPAMTTNQKRKPEAETNRKKNKKKKKQDKLKNQRIEKMAETFAPATYLNLAFCCC